MRKYKFNGKSEVYRGYKVRQIQAVRDFGNVKKGDAGGWICYDGALSHEGDCWIDSDSIIGSEICIHDNAQLIDTRIVGDCMIYGNARIEGCRGSVYGRINHTMTDLKQITSILSNIYDICYSGYEIVNGKKEHYISVGCQSHKVSEWLNESFRNKVIRETQFPKSKIDSFLDILKFICKENRIKI